jgi:hypothetical protein
MSMRLANLVEARELGDKARSEVDHAAMAEGGHK